MTIGLMAEKIGMTQLFLEDGLRVAVTVLQVPRNVVVQKKTKDNDGYLALQVGAGEGKPKQQTMAQAGHFAKHTITPTRSLTEFRATEAEMAKFNSGDVLNLGMFKDVKSVDIAATSKGKGTAGVMKRHHMKGFRATHGTHEYFRHGGSIGMRATPGKVHPGKRMSGRMGNERVSVLNIMVVQMDEEKGLLFLRGAVPGPPGSMVEVRASTHTAKAGKALRDAVQIQSKNPMKASKAGGAAKPAAKKK
jgi:large subunit ribosomal protein L3